MLTQLMGCASWSNTAKGGVIGAAAGGAPPTGDFGAQAARGLEPAIAPRRPAIGGRRGGIDPEPVDHQLDPARG